jgi:hypothetical protein
MGVWAFEDLNGALNDCTKPVRSFQRSCEALKGWFERPCGAFKGEDGRFKSPSNGRLEPLNTQGGGVQKAPLSFEIRVFPLWGPRTPGGPRKGKGRASRFIWGRGPKEALKRGGAPFKGSGRRLNGLGGGGGPDLWSLVRACTGMHAPARSSLHGGARPCTAMYGDARSPLYGDVRGCTPLYARACTPLHPPARRCTLGHVRRCTEVYARARSAMYAHARRRTPLYGGVRLRGPRGGKGGLYGNTLGASGCVPVHVWACTGVCGGARPCTRVQAGDRSGRS